MNNKYRITVIGAGDRGGTYMNMLDKYYKEDAEMLCVCDILQERQEKAYNDYNFKLQESNWQKAIECSQSDIVIIAAPAYLHCDIAAYAMEHGAHVLTEKPFDLDLAKCFALREVSRRTGKKLAIGLQYRNIFTYRAMKHLFNANILGTNRMTVFNDMRETRFKTAMHDAVYGNGGPMVDMACHLFDLMRWYYECDPVSVYCKWSKSATKRQSLEAIENKAADTGVMTITYADGSLGVITMNWGLPEKVNGQYMTYTAGSEALVNVHAIQGDKLPEAIVKGGETVAYSVPEEEMAEMENPEKTVFDYFVKDIENKGKSQASFEDGIISLACSLAAMKSGVLDRPVTLAEIYKEQPTIFEAMQG